ncbi:Cof-type HAD-IIB family hydrolase [Enterococcus sp. LJL98]
MIKLIASDMDGTLLDAEMRISQENIDAIRYAEEQGVEFIIATGRNRFEALPPLEEAGIQCAMITLNGAHVFDKEGNSLFTTPMNKTEVFQIMDILDAHGVYYELSTQNGTYTNSKESRIEQFAAHITETMPHLTHKMGIAMTVAHLEFFPVHLVDDLRELAKKEETEVLKVICFDKRGPAHLGAAGKEIAVFEDCVVTSSGHNNIEINHKFAQKGIAVAHVAKERNIHLDHVMTIGDNLNDLSMIQAAGVSFAMSNALNELKEEAKYLAQENVHSGVGKAIVRAIDERL